MKYFDNGATTRAYDECADIIKQYLLIDYYNPSALYRNAIEIAKKLKNARQNMLAAINGEGGNFIYTASGSEADNLALLSVRKRNNGKIIVSDCEHSAVYQCAKELERRGYNVLFAPVDGFGKVKEEEFVKLLDNTVCLVSIMHVNNETGCINDIEKLAKLTKKYSRGAVFHSDGVQALGKLKIDVNRLGADMYSVSGHKIHAPKGIGGLYVRKGVSLSPIIYGGGQEFNVRSATENIPYVMALDYAVNRIYDCFEEKYSKKSEMQNLIKKEITSNLNGVKCLTPPDASPHILTFAFKDIRGEVLMHKLEQDDFIVGIGSACSSHKGGNRISTALGLEKEYEKGELRISFSEFNTIDEARLLSQAIIKNVTELRNFVQK